jgi:hypothetical protein
MKKFDKVEINVAIALTLSYVANECDDEYDGFIRLPSSFIAFAAGRTGNKAIVGVRTRTDTNDKIRGDCKTFVASCDVYQRNAIRYLIKIMLQKWKARKKDHCPLTLKNEHGRYVLLLAEAFALTVRRE